MWLHITMVDNADTRITVTAYERHGVSYHRQLNGLNKTLCRLSTKAIAKLRITGPFCAFSFRVAGEFPSQIKVMRITFPVDVFKFASLARPVQQFTSHHTGQYQLYSSNVCTDDPLLTHCTQGNVVFIWKYIFRIHFMNLTHIQHTHDELRLAVKIVKTNWFKMAV